jgi:nucleotide-binding universal stress UspA family protein
VIHVENILYATDFSPYSNQAYFHAVALAESHGATLTVVYVYTPPAALAAVGGGMGMPLPADDNGERDYWRGQLKQIWPLSPHVRVRHVLLVGDPAEEILRYAAGARVDLIVMGTHGRTALERLLMGSVAEKVMRGATCSVLVVKLPRGVPVPEPHQVAVAASPV